MPLQDFDDRDNTNLQYAGFWGRTSTYTAANGDSGTLATTNDVNANITFNFPVPARQFFIYGIKRSAGGRYGICIDCDLNAPKFEPIDGLNSADNGRNTPEILYERSFSSLGFHVAILRNEPDERGRPAGNSQLAFDKFSLETGPLPSSSSLRPSNTPRPSATSSGVPGAGSGSGSSAAAIGGGVAGGVVLFILVFLAVFLWRRRRRRPVEVPPLEDLDPYHPPTSSTMVTVAPTSATTSIAPGIVSGTASVSGGGTFTHSHTRSTSNPGTSFYTSSSSAPTDKRRMMNQSPPPQPPRRELDAGPVAPPDVLPPEYGNWIQLRATDSSV